MDQAAFGIGSGAPGFVQCGQTLAAQPPALSFPNPSTFPSMHICILGAGIVGLATAWELQAQGHAVTVVDQAAPGSGTSSGNGAQLSYSYVAPLADGSIWGQLPKLMFAPDSPLKLRPQLDPRQWRWGLGFMAACNEPAAARTTRTLLTLAADSRTGFEAMRAALQPDCDFAEAGKLVLYRGAAGLAAAGRQVALQAALGGAPQRLVTPDEAIALEPALASQHGQFAGAVYTASECVADCLKVCQALAAALQAHGVRFVQAPVLGFERDPHGGAGARVHAVRTGAGVLEAEAFVLALGAASARFGRALGVYLPVYPLKGYSITLPVHDAPGAAPVVSVTDTARKTVFARIGQRLRVAGMAELVGEDLRIPPARIATLQAATRAVFPHAAVEGADPQPWAGLRPATPSGLPLVGRLGRAPANVLFNVGHGALGFTLAFGTARHVARLLAADTAPAPAA